MARLVLLVFAFQLIAFSSLASAAIVEHSFHVGNLTVNRLCQERVITAVNGSLPGPTIRVQEGDILVVHVYNESPYNLTIHWHGVFQLLSGWADGPEMVTQCPIRPENKYTYRFKITDQEGTLWWHAHSQWLRATVYGGLIIHPRSGTRYPYPKPDKEVPIILGEWWNANVIDVENQALFSGTGPNNSDAYTINGKPGNLYPCSQDQTYKLNVVKGKTYLLRIINAALNNQLFYKVANHKLTVVGVDAEYTTPYSTDVIVIAPGQTVDALLHADQPIGSYYMAAHPYASQPAIPFDNTTTRAIIVYEHSTSSSPIMPTLPPFNDTPTAHKFYSNLTSLVDGPHWVPVPRHVDKHMFVTVGLGLDRCRSSNNATCQGPNGNRFSASMNNHSFIFPTKVSMLQGFFFNINGVYSRNFPSQPLIKFDYTNQSLSSDITSPLNFAPKSTSVTRLKFNQTVEMVLQNTALIAIENHPMHLHGFNFHVLAQGFGNFDYNRDSKKFNFVDAQRRNTIAVPVGGWAVIRFQANNPGIWLMHCHLDVHLPWGLATAFEVENGPTPSSRLPPPPADFPKY